MINWRKVNWLNVLIVGLFGSLVIVAGIIFYEEATIRTPLLKEARKDCESRNATLHEYKFVGETLLYDCLEKRKYQNSISKEEEK